MRDSSEHFAGRKDGFGDLLAGVAVSADLHKALREEVDLVGMFIRQVDVFSFFKMLMDVLLHVAPADLFGAEDAGDVDILRYQRDWLLIVLLI